MNRILSRLKAPFVASGLRPASMAVVARRVLLAVFVVVFAPRFATAAPESGTAVTPLTELDPVSVRQGWGTLQIDRSVAGKPIQIGQRKFSTGLGTHAHSELVYALGGRFERFEAWAGIDAGVAQLKGGSVVFKVIADGRELFASGVMRPDTPAQRVSVSVRGVRELKLVVTDAGNRITSDHADWAEAVLVGPPLAAVLLPSPEPAKFRVRSPGLTVELSQQGEIVGAILGGKELRRAVQGATVLEGCTDLGPVSVRQLEGEGLEFTRQIGFAGSGRGAALAERFRPTTNSVRWEIEIRGSGTPWSTGIQTRLFWPANDPIRYWTAWEDPDQRSDSWRDPLVLHPVTSARLSYGAPHWDEESPQPGYKSGFGSLFSIPILTLVETDQALGLSLVLSPEDPLLELALRVRSNGLFTFTRSDHRISSTNTVRFAMDLVAHAADWRASMGWMTRRYPQFFDPPNPRADEVTGLGAYSDWEGELDVAQLKKMGFGVNWKASYDFPYMGMFLPPIDDTELYTRFVKSNQTSILQLREYSRRMRQMGFHVLNYFNVTEFGGKLGMPSEIDPLLPPQHSWKNVNNFLYREIGDGILHDLNGKEFATWKGSIAMDCGGPKYRQNLLTQAQRHLDKLPDSDGICIDRLDWLRFYNLAADDGLSWRRDQPCRALYSSWGELMSRMGPLFHSANKVIFVNAVVSRLELMRQVDGIYHERGHLGPALNAAALLCVRKPCLAWTPAAKTLAPDPDAYFQRHLHLGAFPTAPLPRNDHAISSGQGAERWYLDYGPLFNALHGRKWVLSANVIEVEGAKANLFEVPGGFVAPISFGGKAERARVKVAPLPPFSLLRPPDCKALWPGSREWISVPVRAEANHFILDVPLRRGCAMLQLSNIEVPIGSP